MLYFTDMKREDIPQAISDIIMGMGDDIKIVCRYLQDRGIHIETPHWDFAEVCVRGNGGSNGLHVVGHIHLKGTIVEYKAFNERVGWAFDLHDPESLPQLYDVVWNHILGEEVNAGSRIREIHRDKSERDSEEGTQAVLGGL
jgi:hypothetical protein